MVTGRAKAFVKGTVNHMARSNIVACPSWKGSVCRSSLDLEKTIYCRIVPGLAHLIQPENRARGYPLCFPLRC